MDALYMEWTGKGGKRSWSLSKDSDAFAAACAAAKETGQVMLYRDPSEAKILTESLAKQVESSTVHFPEDAPELKEIRLYPCRDFPN